ncbi:MAG: ATP-binding protein [Candidatus Firestonebacteria bacterium]
MKDYEGDLFSLIRKAEEYILEHINIGMRLEGFRRIDVPEIDKDAFRETIINAFCHRDYYNYDSVNIAIFKDRLEIRSPGLLYGGLTIAKIRKGKLSERRNELIAELFHRVHFVEKWGRGIKLILEREPSAEFEEIGRQFIAVFKRKKLMGKDTVKDTVKFLGERERFIVDILLKNPKTTTQELSKELGINLRNTKKYISQLKEKGVIRRIGSDKSGYWEVISK